MTPITLSLICGMSFGIATVLLMLPMQFPDKRRALLGAFFSRFAIGFLIPLCQIPGVPWPLSGALVGFLISLPDAVITRAYAPIIGVGVLGGGIIGWIVG
ncbi:MAG: hypothetical protein HY253_05705 [Burkholderiales bacterium]|nr:hypothetical protein [Burkholderiales bacterium]